MLALQMEKSMPKCGKYRAGTALHTSITVVIHPVEVV
jgi:hypothetical protein